MSLIDQGNRPAKRPYCEPPSHFVGVIDAQSQPGHCRVCAADAHEHRLWCARGRAEGSGGLRDHARRDGVAAALRTYGRDVDFVFFTDGQSPIGGAGAANEHLNEHPIKGAWKEVARGRSADASLMYSVGELVDGNKRSTHAYVQIWQYDSKVANWGLRVLLVNLLPPPKEQS